MSEENNPTSCHQCGSPLQQGDRFCGSCGAVVTSVTPEDTQVIPRPAAAAQGAPDRNLKRTLLLAGGVGTLLLLLIGGGAMALLGSGGKKVELAPGVYSEVPEGWAVATSGDDGQGVELVPEGYENQEIEDIGSSTETGEARSEEAQISTGESSCTEASEGNVQGGSSQMPGVTSGYDKSTTGSETIATGEATVAGHPATWNVYYVASVTPWRLPNSDSFAMSEYPTYVNSYVLDVCANDLDLSAWMMWSSSLNEGSNRTSEDEPTSQWNGLVPEAREEVHEDLRRRYEANIGVMKALLEEVETEGLFNDGSTDLSEIPSGLAATNEELWDPFEGELAEGGNVPEEAEVPEAEEPTSEEEQFEEFAREYDEASRNEDWEATYAMLYETSQSGVTDSQDEFTEEEWIEIHQTLRDENGPLPELDSVTIDQDEETSDSPALVTFNYEDGTQETITVIIPMAVSSGDETGPQRYLTEEEIEDLNHVAVSGGTTEEFSESTDFGSTAPLGDDFVGDAEEAAEDYYQAAGLEDWEYTYEHLDSETQSLFTREEWFEKNQWLADNGEVIYHIDSVDRVGTSSEYLGVTLTLTYEDGSSSQRTTYFILEDGEWLHRFSQEEIDLFMPELSYEEFVEANE